VVQHRMRSIRACISAGLGLAPRVRGRGQAPLSGPREWRERAVAHGTQRGVCSAGRAQRVERVSAVPCAGSLWAPRMSGRRLCVSCPRCLGLTARAGRAAMGTKGETYADIKLGSKDGGMMGTLKCRPDGIVWESQVRVASCGALRLRPFLPRASAHSCSAARLAHARDRMV